VNADLVAFAARRLAAAVLFILIVSSAAFVLVRLAPGDAATQFYLSPGGTAAVADTRERLGLDRPLLTHLGDWLTGLATFDLGESSVYRRPVSGLVRERAGATARLAALSLLVAAAIGLPLGVLTASRPRLSAAIAPISIALVACPPILAVLGLLLLAVQTNWLSIAPGAYAVPTLALALPIAAMLERLQSRAMSETLASPDLVATAARGVPRARLLWVHAARQSLRPVLGIAGAVVASLFSGSLAVEMVTAWPGLGRLLFDAVAGRDLFLAAGCALVGATLITLANLAADVARAVVDPRVREAG
jgi:ABC-type dipeptide/oligopeptide/nickel transport system permease component